MNSLEAKIWQYIDGDCTPDERAAMEQLIATDASAKSLYQELLAFNTSLNIEQEIDEPSMAFTYKVMEQIRTEQALQPLKARVDSRIIKFIAAFLILLIGTGIIYSFSLVNWQTPANSINMGAAGNNFSKLFTGQFLNISMAVLTVLMLYFADGVLRRKKAATAA